MRLFSLLLSFLFIFVQSDPLRGINPSVSSSYQGNSFKCLDGSHTISISAVNDDYCDCKDASDEPGTSACKNGKFYCVNKGHVPQIIFSSRVNDDICDCCDGSDEYLSNKCQNTCQKEWEVEKIQVQQDIKELEEGIEYTKQKILEHQLQIEQKKKLVAELKEKKVGLTPHLEDHKSQKEDLQNNLNTQTEEIKLQLSLEVDQELSKRLEEEELKRLSEIQENSGEIQENSGEIQENSGEIQENSEIQDDSGEIQEQEDKSPEEKTEEEKQEQADAHKESLRTEIMNEKLNANEHLNALKDEIKKIDDVINEINKEIENLDSQISEHEDFISFDFGPSSRFGYLEDQTFTINSAEYTYTLKVFKEVTQGHTRVGSWKSWENNYTQMMYDHGEHCWGGPDRSMLVNLVCGKQTELTDVKEPNKCEYTMVMKTPGACSEETLEQLRNKLKN